MKLTLLDLADTIISCRKAPTPLNQIQQILQHYSRSEFTDLETHKVVTRLNNICGRLVAPFHPAKIVEFMKIEDNGLNESSVIEPTNSIERNRFIQIRGSAWVNAITLIPDKFSGPKKSKACDVTVRTQK